MYLNKTLKLKLNHRDFYVTIVIKSLTNLLNVIDVSDFLCGISKVGPWAICELEMFCVYHINQTQSKFGSKLIFSII